MVVIAVFIVSGQCGGCYCISVHLYLVTCFTEHAIYNSPHNERADKSKHIVTVHIILTL